jgi:hypothetical protein
LAILLAGCGNDAVFESEALETIPMIGAAVPAPPQERGLDAEYLEYAEGLDPNRLRSRASAIYLKYEDKGIEWLESTTFVDKADQMAANLLLSYSYADYDDYINHVNQHLDAVTQSVNG